MSKAKPQEVPTSVKLHKEQKDYIRKVAALEERTFSGKLREIVTSWITWHQNQGKSK